jgi:hypothetical protein
LTRGFWVPGRAWFLSLPLGPPSTLSAEVQQSISCWLVTSIQYQNLKFLVLHAYVSCMPLCVMLRHRCNFILEGSGLLGCDTMLFNELLLNMSKECSNFNFRWQAVQEMFLDYPSTENEGTMFIGNIQELLIPEYLHSQQQCHKNIRPCSFIMTMRSFTSTVNIMSAMLCTRTFSVNTTVEICGRTVAAAQSCPTSFLTWGVLKKFYLKSLICLINAIFFCLNLYLHKYGNRST